jgi:HAD superfamily hydrolase (TIGR01509 family)
MDLLRRRCWIFDLDGTLTVAIHDFAAIRAALGLPPDRPILEALAELSETEARPRRAQLDRIEREVAGRARPAPGAAALLDSLAARGARTGVLTRNSHASALATLQAAGLERFFDPDDVVGREQAAPKPRPDGIRRLLARWRARAADAVMVGDYRFDLEAGRAAGTATVWVDALGSGLWSAHADLRVERLDQLLAPGA